MAGYLADLHQHAALRLVVLDGIFTDIKKHAVQQVRNPFHHHLLTDKLNSNPVFIRHRLQVGNYALCQLI